MKKPKRSGDINFHEISEEQFNKIKGKEIKHNGSFVFATGEASNHNHVITTPKITDMIIKEDNNGYRYYHLKSDAELSHFIGDTKRVADHKTIPIEKKFYVQIPEREVDIFNKIIRKVID